MDAASGVRDLLSQLAEPDEETRVQSCHAEAATAADSSYGAADGEGLGEQGAGDLGCGSAGTSGSRRNTATADRFLCQAL